MKYWMLLLTFVGLLGIGQGLVTPPPQVVAPVLAAAVTNGLVDLSIRPQKVLTTPTLPPFTATSTAAATDTTTATATASATASLTTTPSPACDTLAWHTVNGLPTSGLNSIAAVSDEDVWVAGSTSYHWDGHTFQQVLFPTPTGSIGAGLAALATGSSTSVWGVGSAYTTYSDYLIEHWDGAQWSILPWVVPDKAAPAAPQASANDVAAVGPNDAFVVGTGVVGPSIYPGFIHCSATGCSAVPTDFAGYLSKVSAVSTGDVWVIGFDPARGYQYVRRWTGNNSTGLVLTATAGLNDIEAVTGDDVWVAGQTPGRASLLEHWNGSSVTTVSSPDIGPIQGIKAHATNDVWAYGNGVLHWDGNAWIQVPRPFASETWDLSPLGPTDVWTLSHSTNLSVLVVEHYANIPTFSDVPAGDTFYPYVEWMACRVIIGGYSCGGAGEPCDGYGRPYFRPGTGVSRGQMLKMVTLAAGWPLQNPATATFADVPVGSTFYPAIETGYAHGSITGYPCGGPNEPCDGGNRPYFRPSAPVSRGQLSKILAVARGYPPPAPPTATFADVPPNNNFYGYVEALAAYGIVSGYPCGGPNEPCDSSNRPYFRPTAGATRAQVSKMVTRAYGGP